MKTVFKPGDSKVCRFTVQAGDVAAFHGTVVHAVCSTFTLAREIEWTTRQFVLEMRDENEEGVGTFLSIDHKGPAFVGEEVVIKASVESLNRNELICEYHAAVGSRLIATGKTGQKILSKEKIDTIFTKS
ncbi:hotdog domain-containing protein [Oscillatoria amoena NRMC-F 0135]|nr:hotdog domain-containing protein [Oscillatoria amoena NRMC-F 0135]